MDGARGVEAWSLRNANVPRIASWLRSPAAATVTAQRVSRLARPRLDLPTATGSARWLGLLEARSASSRGARCKGTVRNAASRHQTPNRRRSTRWCPGLWPDGVAAPTWLELLPGESERAPALPPSFGAAYLSWRASRSPRKCRGRRESARTPLLRRPFAEPPITKGPQRGEAEGASCCPAGSV